VGPAHPRILLAHPRIKVKHIKNKIHLQYLCIIYLWFKIWPTPAKNHCYALANRRQWLCSRPLGAALLHGEVPSERPIESPQSDRKELLHYGKGGLCRSNISGKFRRHPNCCYHRSPTTAVVNVIKITQR
jgi:hypothetical protein